MKKILLSLTAVWVLGSVVATAQEKSKQTEEAPTMVFGSAATPDGGQNMFLVEQPKDAPNPMGDPLYIQQQNDNIQNQNETLPDENKSTVPTEDMSPTAEPQSNNSAVNAENLGKDFQNTLMEANGRVYDIQSFPEQDLKVMSNPADPQTIYSPNVND